MTTEIDVTELRLMADKAKMAGRFDAGQTLHELCDAFESWEATSAKVEELEAQVSDLNDELSEAKTENERLEKEAKDKAAEVDKFTDALWEIVRACDRKDLTPEARIAAVRTFAEGAL